MNTCRECGSQMDGNGNCPKCSAPSREGAKSLIGTTLAGKYLIEDHLGSGGMCDVYSATHMAMGKKVAVKVLKPELAVDSKVAQRFEQEARAASRIHHPNAINVIDYGENDARRPYIVMEFVDGITLGELLRREGALSVERAATILRQVCGALDAAHAVGVIHRDIKPDNIIIADYGGSDWVEVLDFGIAKIQDDVNRRVSLTGANIIVGTPRYMSPEQCEEKPVDPRSDIYSLGIVLYEMLAGDTPFQGDSSTRLLVAHATEPPAPLREKRPDLSKEIEDVVMRALAKNPVHRPQTASELSRQFEESAGIAQQAQAGTTRGGAFSRISVPIASSDANAVESEPQAGDTLDDEATVVRQRPVRAVVPVTNTPDFDRADTPYNIERAPANQEDVLIHSGNHQYSTPAHGTTYVTGAHERRGGAGWVIGLVLLLVVAGVAAYIVWGDKLFGRAGSGDGLMNAIAAITDARARVDSLPPDHALRRYLPQLSQWQGELQAFQQVSDRSPQTMDKADRYQQQAENISAQARAALIALGRDPGSNANTSPSPNSNAQGVPGAIVTAPPREGEQPVPEGQAQPAVKPETEGEKEKSEPPPPPPPLPEEEGPENTNKKPRKPPAAIPIKPGPSNTNKPPII